jgi:hypothetical protein
MNSDTGTLVLLIVLAVLVAVTAFLVVLSMMKISSLAARREGATPTDHALAELRNAVYRLEQRLAEVVATSSAPPIDRENLDRSLEDIRVRVEALAADFDRFAHPPQEEPARPNLGDIEARIDGMRIQSDADEAFRRQCRAEVEILRNVRRKYTSEPDWTPDSGDRSFLLKDLFAPARMDPLEVSRANRGEAAQLLAALDELRAEAIDSLQARFAIEPIAPVPGSVFDPLLHEDNPETRQTPPDPAKANSIYERVAIGFTKRGEVLERAWVKRYSAAEVSLAPPEPASPSFVSEPVTPLEPPGPADHSESAESLLRKAASND